MYDDSARPEAERRARGPTSFEGGADPAPERVNWGTSAPRAPPPAGGAYGGGGGGGPKKYEGMGNWTPPGPEADTWTAKLTSAVETAVDKGSKLVGLSKVRG